MATPAAHVWRPSLARLIKLDWVAPAGRGGTLMPPPSLQWPAKDPSDVLDYQLDIAAAVAGDLGDSIATLDVTISPEGAGNLTLNSASADGTIAVLWLAGGLPGTTYVVCVRIGTEAGRVIARNILLPVMAMAAPPGGTSVQADGSAVLVGTGTLSTQ